MCTQTRAASLMANIPQADIDPSGVFKYVLVRVHSREEGDDSEVDIVRGYSWAEYHGKRLLQGQLRNPKRTLIVNNQCGKVAFF